MEELYSVGKKCSTYTQFLNEIKKYKIAPPLPDPKSLPKLPENLEEIFGKLKFSLDVPNLDDLGKDSKKVTTPFIGGEYEALKIMKDYLKDKKRVK